MTVLKGSVKVLAAAVAGIVCAVICGSLLIASQVKQYWIYYYTKSYGSITSPLVTTYTATLNAQIGLWDTYFTIATDFTSAFVPDQYIASTVDSSTTGYFSEASVKACRALAIIATISIFTSITTSVVSLFICDLPRKVMQIITVSAAGFTTFLITLSLIVVRTQFKDGMSIDSSFNICIGANILAGVSVVCFVAGFILSSAELNKTNPVTNETGMKQSANATDEKKTGIQA